MNFGHIGFAVRNLAKSRDFYRAALEPFGLELTHEDDEQVRFGREGKTFLYIHTRGNPPGPFHLALEIDSRELVDEFYEAALAHGGEDNGAPGVREDYSPTYYAAFILDPDGHNIEAVCRS